MDRGIIVDIKVHHHSRVVPECTINPSRMIFHTLVLKTPQGINGNCCSNSMQHLQSAVAHAETVERAGELLLESIGMA